MLNVVRCDKMSTIVAAARAHPDKTEKDFDAVVTYIMQCVVK